MREGQVAIEEGGEPVHEPELEHKGASDLGIDLRVELLLSLRAQTVHGSHLGEPQSVLHVLEGTLKEHIGCSHYDH